MRVKGPFSLKADEMTKRSNRPRKPRDEESSDEVTGKYKCSNRQNVFLYLLGSSSWTLGITAAR